MPLPLAVAFIGRILLEQNLAFNGVMFMDGRGTTVTVTDLVLLIGEEQAKLVPVQVISNVAEVNDVLSGGLTVGLLQLVHDNHESVPGV